MEIKIDGLTALMAKLEHLGGSSETAIDKGLARGTQAIKRDAKSICPYDTGRLKGSITSEKLAPCTYAVGTNVEYASYVEYGTGQRGDPKIAHTTAKAGQSPQPFLHPALTANKSYVLKSVQVELLRAIKEKMK